MPTPRKQASEKKRERKRAEKKKHAHRTEEMAERAGKRKRSRWEASVVLIVLFLFVFMMIFSVVWWPSKQTPGEQAGETGVSSGTYSVSYVDTQPATSTSDAVAALDLNGAIIFVNPQDLTGAAAQNSAEFFEGKQGEPIEIQVKDGYITDFTTSAPKN